MREEIGQVGYILVDRPRIARFRVLDDMDLVSKTGSESNTPEMYLG